MKKYSFILSLLLSSSLLFVACKKTDPPVTKSLLELASTKTELSTFLAAMERAGLSGTLNSNGSFTVFAPTNVAFTAYLAANGYANLEAVPVATLKQLLQYHTLIGELKSGSITKSYVASLATFGTSNSVLKLYLENTGTVLINNSATVTTADLSAGNGVLHVVNKVITLPKVVDFIQNDLTLSAFLVALTRADLSIDYFAMLTEPGPFTVFAPDNAAFASLLIELGLDNINDIPADMLNTILQYHIVPNANLSADQLEDTQELTTLGGRKFSINAGNKLTDQQGRQGNLITLDIQANNGVVHSLDRVLRPN